MDWRIKAACKGMNLKEFYPPKGQRSVGQAQRIRKICQSCPVRMECLRDVLMYEYNGSHGLQSGFPSKVRVKIKRALRPDRRPEDLTAGELAKVVRDLGLD